MFSKRLRDAFKRAFTDKTAEDELFAVLGASVGQVVAMGTFTTAGGDTAETIPATGVLATDVAVVSIATAGAVPTTIVEAVAAADSISVTLAADPDNDHVLSYIVTRSA